MKHLNRNSAAKTLVALCWLLVNSLGLAETKITYLHNDLLGSPVVATDEQGQVVWRKSYAPFGAEETSEGQTQVASRDPGMGYTGHAFDKSTQLVYAGARFYNPQLGIFISRDPATLKEGVPITFNRYIYANNNPYKYVDRDGRTATLAWELGTELAAEGTAVCGPYCGAAGALIGVGIWAGGNAVMHQNSGQHKSENAEAGQSPHVDPTDVAGKTPEEIDQLAKEKGLVPKGPDPKSGSGSYVDPVTGKQRVLIHPSPDSECSDPHCHVNNPEGERLNIDGDVVPKKSPDAHLPLNFP